MTGDLSMSQLNRVSRPGVFLIDEYFLIGIGSYTRKNMANKSSNGTIKYQLSGIFHHPGKRFRFYHQNLLADNNLASEGMTVMHEVALTNESISKYLSVNQDLLRSAKRRIEVLLSGCRTREHE